jgi:ubiquinone biosynthesis accessory factor UbiJ
MSLALLQTALLLPVEALINRTLTLDPASVQRLASLEDLTLAIHTTQPTAQLFISFRNGKVHLGVVDAGSVAASLHGPLRGMLALLRQQSLTSLHTQGIELRGSTAFVQQVQQLLQGLEIDWEFYLARFLGDIPTQALGSGARQARNFASGTAARLREDVTEFLHEETRLLVTPAELEQHYAKIAELALHADRVQARIDRLLQGHW